MITGLKKIVLLGSLLLATGCVSKFLATEPASPRYLIGPVSADLVSGDSVEWSLSIDSPNAARAFDTTKVAVSRRTGRIEYFADGEWAGRAPRIFQTALIESFQDSNRIVAVGDRTALPISDYVLQSDIRMIAVDLNNGTPQASLKVYVRFTNGKSKIYATQSFSAKRPTSSLSGDDVAMAFDDVFRDVMAEIVAWAFDQGQSAQAANAGS